MADQARLNEALLTLQRVLLTYSAEDVSGMDMQLVDGQLPEGFFESISAFIQDLTGIENVSLALHEGGQKAQGTYDPAIGQALKSQLPTLNTVLQGTDEDQARRALRAQDAPEILTQNPSLMVEFIGTDLAPMVEALDILSSEKLLGKPPVDPELRAAQPKALENLASTLNEHIEFYADLHAGFKENQSAALAELPQDAPAEERDALADKIKMSDQAIELLSRARTQLESANFSNFAEDENAQKALASTVEYLQTQSFYAHTPGNDGLYSTGFESHLQGVLETNAALIEDLNGRTFPSDAQKTHRNMLNRLVEFEAVMEEMVRTKAYNQPVVDIADANPVKRAQPVIEEAIDYMARKGKTGFNPVLGEADGGAFEYESRLTLQAFLINLKVHLEIGDGTINGAYTSATRAALVEAFKDPAKVTSVAREFFKGDEAKVAGLIEALDTYSNPVLVADIDGVPSNIASVNLLVVPQVKPSEIAVLQAAIDRIPEDELGAINELATTLSGFGLNHIMPIEAFSDEQNNNLLAAKHNRAEVLGNLFEKVYGESVVALKRDGRPSEDISIEMKERLAERLDSVLGGHGVYSAVHRETLQAFLDQAVDKSLEAYSTIGTTDEERLQAASSVFAGFIPATSAFLQSYGVNERAYSYYSPDGMEGTTPHAIKGFAGALDNKTIISSDAASALPDVNALFDEMEQGYQNLSYSEVGQRTFLQARAAVDESRILIEQLYQEANVDGSDAPLIIHDVHGESVLVTTQDDETLKITYLDAHGVNGLDDASISQIQVNESFGFDRSMVRAALAGFQAHNEGVEYVDNYNPEFFTVAGRSYVVGMEDDTKGLQIIPINPDLITPENSNDIHAFDNTARMQDVYDRLADDPAYSFVKRNYSAQFTGATNVIFKTMADELAQNGHTQAQRAAHIFENQPAQPGDETAVPIPVPLEGEARNLALKSAFDSASGFQFDNYKSVTFGEPIRDTALLAEMLGYDPNEAFVNSGYANPQNSFVIHGLEPEVWSGDIETDPFLKDHLIVTFKKDDEIQSVAIDKRDLQNNPLRLQTILQNEVGLEDKALIHAADRFSTTLVEGMGVTVQTRDLWATILEKWPLYKDDVGLEPYPSGPVTPRFWVIDGENYQNSHSLKPADVNAPEEEDHTSLQTPHTQSQVTKLAQLAQSIDEITIPYDDLSMTAGGGGIAPSMNRQPALATMKI